MGSMDTAAYMRERQAQAEKTQAEYDNFPAKYIVSIDGREYFTDQYTINDGLISFDALAVMDPGTLYKAYVGRGLSCTTYDKATLSTQGFPQRMKANNFLIKNHNLIGTAPSNATGLDDAIRVLADAVKKFEQHAQETGKRGEE